MPPPDSLGDVILHGACDAPARGARTQGGASAKESG